MANLIKYSIFQPQPNRIQTYDENNVLSNTFTSADGDVAAEWVKITTADGKTTADQVVGAAIYVDENNSLIEPAYTVSPNYNFAAQMAAVVSSPADPITGTIDIGGGGGGTVDSVVAGTGIDVDDTDPANPVVSATVAGIVESVVAGTNVTVDNTDPANPIVSATGGGGGGGVTDVSASSPLASSGGDTPDISLTGVIPIANGGTNATSASDARDNLGLGTLATQDGTFSGDSSGTNTGDQDLSGLLVKASNLSDVVSANTSLNNLLPSQGGNTGKFLKSDGADSSWATAGTVTTTSVVTANGISGSVANATTTPAITLALGNITPSKVNISTVLGDSTTPAPGGLSQDNVIVAWGDIASDGTINSQYGNFTVEHTGTGIYTISFPNNLLAGVIIGSLESTSFGFFKSSYGSSTGIAYTATTVGVAADKGFYFVLTGRPS